MLSNELIQIKLTFSINLYTLKYFCLPIYETYDIKFINMKTNNDDEEAPIKDIPFSLNSVKRVARQPLCIHSNENSFQRGISQKSSVILSIACGKFLEQLTKKIMENNTDKVIGRRLVVSTFLSNPRYRFAITRLKTNEIFDLFDESNDLSKRIAISNIATPIPTPIPFYAPNITGRHLCNESEAIRRESENVEAVIKALVFSHHAYRQTVPSFLINKKNDT